MRVRHNVTPSGLYLYLEGEIDEHSAKEVREKIDLIIEKFCNANCVIFNMAGVTFMDSTGIGMIIGRYKKIKCFRLNCYIESPSFCVEKVFLMSGIYKLIPKI